MTFATDVILSARAIGKSFGPIRAIDAVDLDLHAGAVHALVGENGAGKSTLARIIAGTHRPDSGTMTLLGQPYRPAGRTDAQRRGVRMVMQELNLFPTLTIAENIFLEDLPRRFGVIRYKKLHARTRSLLAAIGLADLPPDRPVGSLTVGSRQMVEIAAGLSQDCRLLILDEPTASLTDRETRCFRPDPPFRSPWRRYTAIFTHRRKSVIVDAVTISATAAYPPAIDDQPRPDRQPHGRPRDCIAPRREVLKGAVALCVQNSARCEGSRILHRVRRRI